jgi:hypothetical protein
VIPVLKSVKKASGSPPNALDSGPELAASESICVPTNDWLLTSGTTVKTASQSTTLKVRLMGTRVRSRSTSYRTGPRVLA